MAVFSIRTEDLKGDHVRDLFVETAVDRQVIEALKSTDPTILIGSRGTGKSFLMRVSEGELEDSYEADHVLPVYISFKRSSLIHVKQDNKFLSWMMSKICSQVGRALRSKGVISPAHGAILELGKNSQSSKFDKISKAFEESWRTPDISIDVSDVPDLDDFTQEIEDLCDGAGIDRICLFFDEAAHVFRQAQQHAFFTLFRDLRSPYITCNAAVYPGVTSFGDSFEMAHDATPIYLERDIQDKTYIHSMKEIADKQISKIIETGRPNDVSAANELKKVFERAATNSTKAFNAVAYCASGNPRHFLKTLASVRLSNTTEVNDYIKEYYRTEIWKEHSELGEKYPGLSNIVDWGRKFIESRVVPETVSKNSNSAVRGTIETTLFFWIHRRCPAEVDKALGLLSYSGVVREMDRFSRATRNQIGTRYALNFGVLMADAPSPTSQVESVVPNLSVKRLTEFGENHPSYSGVVMNDLLDDDDLLSFQAISDQLEKTVEDLELTTWQKSKLLSNEFLTVKDVLEAGEEGLQQIYMVGDVRSKIISNAAMAAVLEYLLG